MRIYYNCRSAVPGAMNDVRDGSRRGSFRVLLTRLTYVPVGDTAPTRVIII